MSKDTKDKRGRMIHIRLSEQTHKKVRIRTAELDTSIQEWVGTLIEKALREKK